MLASACQEKNDDEKNSPPASPTLVAPTDAADGVNTSPAFVWACVDPDNDAVTFSIYLSANNPPDSLVISDLATAPYSITGLDYFKSYYWQVVAKDPEGAETKGPVWKFTTTANAGPGAPQTPGPDYMAIDIPLTQRLSWWPCTDTEQEIVRYDVYLSEVNPPNALIASELELPLFDIAGLESSKTYYWQVVAKDSYGNATPGPVWQFSTLIDFRDGFVGEYDCMWKCITAHVGDSVVVEIDTGYNHIIGIEKFADSSLKVINMGGWPPNYEFRYVPGGNSVRFEDPFGSGPDDYVEFFENDSIHGYDDISWVHYCHYYGKKLNKKSVR